MTKWCITWDDTELLIKAFKKKEEEKRKEGRQLYMDSHSLAYALRLLFEHKGFWMEEENDG